MRPVRRREAARDEGSDDAINGADVWAIEAMPSPEGVAAFVSPSGKFDDIGPRMAPDEALSVAVAPRCSSLPTWTTDLRRPPRRDVVTRLVTFVCNIWR